MALMKLVLIAYNEALEGEVAELLRRCAVSNYTKWTKVLGRGSTSGPHLGSSVWPKQNDVLATAVSEETAHTLLEGIRQLRQTIGREGLKAFLLPLEDVT